MTDINDDYVRAGFNGRLAPGAHPALILVDFARAYFDPACGLYARPEMARDMAVRLAKAARGAAAPVVFTRVEYIAGDPQRDGGHFYRKVPALQAFDRGNPFGDFTAELSPEAKDVIVTKHYPSAFFGTGLGDKLRARGIDTVLVAGLTTSGCVRATALDVLCEGFVPFVVRDASADRDPAVHKGNLFDLQAKYAEVVETAVMIDYLNSLRR
ncbi:MAG: isochorismatase family protein [Sphingomicrobium sp.]